ncbi:hypothetical protein CkaCkLH20_09824 [Colletotrichum karsti]|uniref:Uncharacterized protein n=1 Tax=Colletotrichum karsti TaxID=1095194 RepID=A0A9P6HYS9_9PEZI|nr:uncharacterized protein CkaCkLH20_09824 [Colletotrichum karsti]KAF9872645.1 hypothetical protein CkaCkLH20_09824 [Colletotrichum karsti]
METERSNAGRLAAARRPMIQSHVASLQRNMAPRKVQYSSGTTEYTVQGNVNGVNVAALPDTGSDECMISSSLASKLGHQPNPGTERMITLANKKRIHSPGMVEVIWKFGQESIPHKLKCWMLPTCSNDLILGSRFLETTKTLTSFLHRVQKRLIPRRLRLRLLGQVKKRLMGILNGRNTTALADTGSDLMLVSAEYARLYGLFVSSGREDRVEVELADGTRTWTSGIVRDATWTLGDLTVQCDFHVLEDLSVDVILSKDYIFELEVFSKHGELFFDMDLMEELSLLCGVRLVDEEAYDLDALEGEFMRDVTSEDAFSFEKIRRERLVKFWVSLVKQRQADES